MSRTSALRLRNKNRPLLVLSWDGIVWQALVLPLAQLMELDALAQQDDTPLLRWRGVADSALQALDACLSAPEMESAPALGGVLCCLPQVYQQLLSLPIDPQRPPPPHAFAAAVGYQLREGLQGSTWSRSIGAALVAAGHLQVGDVKQVLDFVRDQQQRWLSSDSVDYAENDSLVAGAPELQDARPGTAVIRAGRFGDAACELGLINRSQLNEAIARQTLSISSDDELSIADLASGWHAIGGSEAKQHRWSYAAAAMLRQERDALTRSAEVAGLRLLGIMPLLGSASGTLPPGSTATLVQIHHGVVGVVHLREGVVRDVQVHSVPDACPAARHVAPLIESGRGTVVMAGDLIAPEMLEELRLLTGLAIDVVPQVAMADAPLVGAARLYAGVIGSCSSALIPARDAVLHWWQRPGLWLGAVVVAGLAVSIGAQIAGAWVDAQVDRLRLSIQDANSGATDPQQQELSALRQRISEARRQLRERQQGPAPTQVEGPTVAWLKLLRAIAEAHQASIRLDAVDGKEPSEGVRIMGRARSASDAQKWYSQMSSSLQGQGWSVHSWELSEDEMPLDFTLRLRIPLGQLAQQGLR